MVSFAQLRDARIDEMDSAWRSWREAVKSTEQAEDAYQAKVLQHVRAARWKGDDAKAAMRTLLETKIRVQVSSGEAAAVAAVLHAAQQDFKLEQRKLKSYIQQAESLYLTVGPNGSLDFPQKLPARYSTWEEYKQVAYRLQLQFRQAVSDATKADMQAAAALNKLLPDVLASKSPLHGLRKDAGMATGFAGWDPKNIPPPEVKNAKQTASWWNKLPEEQRQLLMNAYPNRVGWMDGIPSEDRDQANRVYLTERLNDLRAITNPTDYEQRRIDRLEGLQKSINAEAFKGRDVYLLGLGQGPHDDPHTRLLPQDDEGAGLPGADGQAIVAFGNPDTAQHTGVYVPGTGSTLDKFPGGVMSRAAALWDVANGQPQAAGQVSTIAWLGYDAPDRISADATTSGYSEVGGRNLVGFIDGVRATQDATGQSGGHVTAIGHSYGSTVIGEATKVGDGLAVDDIVVAGSPGMHVTHAKDLGVGEDHVWTQRAQGDDVPELGRQFHGGRPTIPFTDLPYAYGPPVVPTDEQFGGNRMAADTHGHTNYWNELDKESIKNQARVIVGAYDQVKPE